MSVDGTGCARDWLLQRAPQVFRFLGSQVCGPVGEISRYIDVQNVVANDTYEMCHSQVSEIGIIV